MKNQSWKPVRRCVNCWFFEGKTEKQKNPHSRDNLAWATWLIARLGGWKGFASQRPPGVIILRMGLQRFHAIFEGWRIAKDVYKR